MHSIRNVRAACRAPLESLGHLLSKNRAATRVSVAAIALSLVVVVSQQGVSRAVPEPLVTPPHSILPANIGVGVATDASVVVPFDRPVDRASVEGALSLIPNVGVRFTWSADSRSVEISPQRLWVTDERYVVIIPSAVRYRDGTARHVVTRLSFTTETAPVVTDFQLQYVPQDPARLTDVRGDGLSEYAPRDNGVVAGTIKERMRAAAPRGATRDTAAQVSAHTAISIEFSSPMDAAQVAARFAISPHVAGDLSWSGRTLVFAPSEPLEPGARYAISLAGTHDNVGNPLGGDSSFSFTTITAGQPIKVSPKAGAGDIKSGDVELWFSQPMAADRTAAAFGLTDLTTKTKLGGTISWNESRTQLHFKAKKSLARGHTFRISIAKGAMDGDGNNVSFGSTFKSRPAPVAARTLAAQAIRPAPPPPAPSSSASGYALNQVNAARSAYGFGAVALNGAVSAVANAHAWDMLRNGYFSHTGRDGSTIRTRLSGAGIAYSYAGENICYLAGQSVQATLTWCHAQFMAEPYPGVYNHIGNILDPNFGRLGVGIAASGGRIYVVWDYAG